MAIDGLLHQFAEQLLAFGGEHWPVLLHLHNHAICTMMSDA